MRILITGGAGYIGTELTAELALDPRVKEIVVYDNLSRANYNLFLGNRLENEAKVRFVKADILDSRSLNACLEGIDFVYHLAAKVTTPFANHGPHEFEQVNHWGTAEVANAIEKNKIPRSLFLSSASVYGASSQEVDESNEPNPQTFYGISKANGEMHFSRLFEKSNSLTIRCGNVYGYSRSMRFDGVINKFMFNANFRGRIEVNGDGHQVRSFAHIDSVAKILARIWDAKLPPGVFNLVEKTLSINEIVDEMKRIYPELELIFVNRDIKLRELCVRPNPRINAILRTPPPNLADSLDEFSRSFSF